jgi:hypothetical protein
MVLFRHGTPQADEEVLRSCAGGNPVVIRIGTLQGLSNGWRRAMIYTHVLGDNARTAGLLKCLHSSGLAAAGWPD